MDCWQISPVHNPTLRVIVVIVPAGSETKKAWRQPAGSPDPSRPVRALNRKSQRLDPTWTISVFRGNAHCPHNAESILDLQGGEGTESNQQRLSRYHIPHHHLTAGLQAFGHPHAACKTFHHIHDYNERPDLVCLFEHGQLICSAGGHTEGRRPLDRGLSSRGGDKRVAFTLNALSDSNQMVGLYGEEIVKQRKRWNL